MPTQPKTRNILQNFDKILAEPRPPSVVSGAERAAARGREGEPRHAEPAAKSSPVRQICCLNRASAATPGILFLFLPCFEPASTLYLIEAIEDCSRLKS